jgi:DNA polymerase
MVAKLKAALELIPTSRVVPATRSLPELAAHLPECRGCPLYANGTRPVFGEGKRSARVVFVGEQPGNVEEQQGRPFVGPAGRMFDRALKEAGFERSEVYLTNAVKHFNFEERGKARLHKRPLRSHVVACEPWLHAELKAIRPRAIVLLGATAASSVLGPAFKLSAQRGKPVGSEWAEYVMATWHPSAVLRAADAESRERTLQELISDLKALAQWLAKPATRSAAAR